MGGFFGGGAPAVQQVPTPVYVPTPAPPPPAPVATPAPSATDANDAAQQQLASQAKKKGRASTILTGDQLLSTGSGSNGSTSKLLG